MVLMITKMLLTHSADSENDLPTEEPTTPPLPPSSQSIHEYDKRQLDDSSSYPQQMIFQIKMTDRQKIRSAKIYTLYWNLILYLKIYYLFMTIHKVLCLCQLLALSCNAMYWKQ